MKNIDSLYSEPELVQIYDVINAGRADFDFYLSQLPSAPCTILDVGCGTGLFAVELATLGHAVTGLDPAVEMLAVARTRRAAHQVIWHTGVLADFAVTQRFEVIVMTGHAFQCLLTVADMDAFFHSACALLAPGGVLLFESRNPNAKAWQQWTPAHAGPPVILEDGRTVQLVHEVIKQDGPYVTFEERYTFLPGGGQKLSTSTLRFSSKTEILAMADAAGFGVTALWGDWSGAAFDEYSSPEMIFSLNPR
ncbi:class I SAM-dependent methyltransferase [Shimia sp.]|uniref:class I SAM-dependent methyltransferase n=1 Tax=Shimia sp. TaxID=1954381 RepID=UPI003B8AA5B7